MLTYPTKPLYFLLVTSDSLVVTTHIFSFYSREEHNWQPRLMLFRHQPGSLNPSSLRRFLKKSGRPGKKVTPSFPLFHLFSSPSNEIHFNGAIFLSDLMEEIELDTFLKEDQATLAKRGRESVAHVVRELWDYLQCECGEGEVLPNNGFYDMMLQVCTCIYIYLF